MELNAQYSLEIFKLVVTISAQKCQSLEAGSLFSFAASKWSASAASPLL
jgi:hypothetical protein